MMKASVYSWVWGIRVFITSFQKSSIDWPQQLPIEKVLKFNVIFMILLKILSSDFLDLRNLCSLIDLSSLCNLTGLNSLYSPISSQNIVILMVWSSMVSKWPIPGLFCGMDHQKSKISLIYGTLSVGGCWGQPMLIFWKLDDETQISQPKEYTDA